MTDLLESIGPASVRRHFEQALHIAASIKKGVDEGMNEVELFELTEELEATLDSIPRRLRRLQFNRHIPRTGANCRPEDKD